MSFVYDNVAAFHPWLLILPEKIREQESYIGLSLTFFSFLFFTVKMLYGFRILDVLIRVSDWLCS